MFLKSTPMFFWGLTVYRKNIDNFVESFNVGDNRQKRLKGTPSLSLKMSMEFHLLNLKQANGALNNVQFFFSKSFIWGTPFFIGTLGHQPSLEHDVTQPAPIVTSQSERNRNVEKISTKPPDSYPRTAPIRVNLMKLLKPWALYSAEMGVHACPKFLQVPG